MGKNRGNFEIIPCDKMVDVDHDHRFKKLSLTETQKIQMGGLIQQLPIMLAASSLSGAYTIQFPAGISGHLIQYRAGGVGTPIQGAGGKIVGHASLEAASSQTAVLGAFSVMAVVSGQYFLAQINDELKTMNQNIDKILEFLYGDKRAELISEVSFVKSAYQNYSSIMDHEAQRIATLISLQESKKVAIKDIEFYMSDLDSMVNAKSGSDIIPWMEKIFQIKDCLELSMQLYSMSSLLEIYYSQNYEADYISNVEEESVIYIGKCEKRMLGSFSKLSAFIQTYKEGPLRKIDKPALEKKVNLVIDSYGKGTESEIVKSIRSVVHAPEEKTEYYIASDGSVYLKAS